MMNDLTIALPMGGAMSKKLDEVESRVKEFCLYLERNYPKEYQGSAEYTRLWRTLEAFLQWGYWSKHEVEG